MTAADAVVERPVADEDLIERVRSGDETAFRLLYERYFRRIYHFVDKRLRNRADAEEAVQEVFCNVFSSLHTYRGEAPFAAWVFGLTRRTLANRFKKKQHPTVPLDDEEGEGVNLGAAAVRRSPDPLEAYEYLERMTRMDRVVSRHLTSEQQDMFRLHHLQHHSIQEIARALEKSENAVKSHLYRARKLLLAR